MFCNVRASAILADHTPETCEATKAAKMYKVPQKNREPGADDEMRCDIAAIINAAIEAGVVSPPCQFCCYNGPSPEVLMRALELASAQLLETTHAMMERKGFPPGAGQVQSYAKSCIGKAKAEIEREANDDQA